MSFSAIDGGRAAYLQRQAKRIRHLSRRCATARELARHPGMPEPRCDRLYERVGRKLTPTELAMYAAIRGASRHGFEGAHLSVAALAQIVGRHERTVQRALRGLEAVDLVRQLPCHLEIAWSDGVKRRSYRRRQTACVYVLGKAGKRPRRTGRAVKRAQLLRGGKMSPQYSPLRGDTRGGASSRRRRAVPSRTPAGKSCAAAAVAKPRAGANKTAPTDAPAHKPAQAASEPVTPPAAPPGGGKAPGGSISAITGPEVDRPTERVRSVRDFWRELGKTEEDVLPDPDHERRRRDRAVDWQEAERLIEQRLRHARDRVGEDGKEPDDESSR